MHVNTLPVQHVLAEPAWEKKLSDEDRRGPTALFWSNVNPYGAFRLNTDKHLDLGLTVPRPRPRTPADFGDRSSTELQEAPVPTLLTGRAGMARGCRGCADATT
ncbi:hypothetical protein ACFY00_15735 [Kitasatospora sp. NPDC001540]|uniref:hypothetical protein n=1 Tax=Kitasatospora sp. NPDC001540 TaxID=3364014 RepID=UPI0036AC86AD